MMVQLPSCRCSLRATERRNPRTADIDTAEPLQLVDLFVAEDAPCPLPWRAGTAEHRRGIDLVEAAFRRGGRLFYVGAGTSGRLGVLDASECPPTFGTTAGDGAGNHRRRIRRAGPLDRGGGGRPRRRRTALDARGVTARDVVVGIAASGTTPFVHGALVRARRSARAPSS